jgi:NADH dehydrogenase [ubiquinone] 1 alpha subcomplex assembly factor 7
VTPLGVELARRIERDGPLPVAEYMQRCLLDPQHGYYRTQTAIGAAGDFITAPEISQMFGELIGLWAAQVWMTMGSPARVRLVELGPGRGTLMADALRATAKVAPEFHAAIDLHLVEANPRLRERQAEALAAARPHWHDAFDSVPDGPAVVIANEFFDALPVRQIVRIGGEWRERVVDHAKGRFVFAAGTAASAPRAPLADAPDGSVVETSPAGEAVAAAISTRLARTGGAALIIDYGPGAPGVGDTLQAVRAHRKVDPLAEPGLADLTAHVDFAGLARAGRGAGAEAYGPLPQGTLLHRLGIAARAATLLRNATPQQARDVDAGVRRLIEPDEMGTLFKALALAHPDLPVPPGFDAPMSNRQ